MTSKEAMEILLRGGTLICPNNGNLGVSIHLNDVGRIVYSDGSPYGNTLNRDFVEYIPPKPKTTWYRRKYVLQGIGDSERPFTELHWCKSKADFDKSFPSYIKSEEWETMET